MPPQGRGVEAAEEEAPPDQVGDGVAEDFGGPVPADGTACPGRRWEGPGGRSQ